MIFLITILNRKLQICVHIGLVMDIPSTCFWLNQCNLIPHDLTFSYFLVWKDENYYQSLANCSSFFLFQFMSTTVHIPTEYSLTRLSADYPL